MPSLEKKQTLSLNDIKESEGGLYIVRDKRGEKYLELIMNAIPVVLGIDFSVNTADAEILINLNGDYILLKLSQLTNIPSVNKVFATCPFKGKTSDLPYFQEWLYNKTTKAKELQRINYAGKIENSGLWCLRDGIYKDGELLYSFTDPCTEIYETDNVIYLIELGRESVNPLYIPLIKKDNVSAPVSEVLDYWLKQYNDKVLLAALLGFFCANVKMDQVQKLRGVNSFPQFFIFGTTEGGKTALCRSSMHFWGVDYSAISISGGTPFPIFRSTSTLNQVPIWYDEYRRKIGPAKEDFLRTNFDRTEFERGRQDQKVNVYKNRATLLLSGEDDIKDNANRRRAVSFMLHKKHKINKQEFERVYKYGFNHFAELFKHCLKTKFNEEIFNKIYNSGLETPNSVDEERMCYASLGGIFGEDLAQNALDEANDYWKEFMAEVKTPSLAVDFLGIIDTWFKKNNKYKIDYNTFGALEWVDIDEDSGHLLIASASLSRILQNDPMYFQNYELGVKAVNRQLIEDYAGAYNCRRYMMGTQQRVVSLPYEENKDEDNFNELYSRIRNVKDQLASNSNDIPYPF